MRGEIGAAMTMVNDRDYISSGGMFLLKSPLLTSVKPRSIFNYPNYTKFTDIGLALILICGQVVRATIKQKLHDYEELRMPARASTRFIEEHK